MPSEHSKISPSSAKRWMACPKSVALSEQFEQTTSIYAEEGTLAHSIGELEIRFAMQWINKFRYEIALTELKHSPHYNKEMHEYAKGYADYILNQYYKARAEHPEAQLFIERKLSLDKWMPSQFGTGDACIAYSNTLDIYDLKFGKGVKVEADNNEQLRIYALGWLDLLEDIINPTIIRYTIYQPRIDNIVSEIVTCESLIAWGENEVKPKALLALNGEGNYAPGEHCKFCPAKGACAVYAKNCLETIEPYEFANPDLLDATSIAVILDKSAVIRDWLNAVETYALEESVKGNLKIPGYKLVEGRSNRKWADESKASETLAATGIDKNTYLVTKLKSITELEKEMGKAMFNELLSEHVIKPQGAPTLVHESDKRPELNTAKADKYFSKIE